MPYRCDIYIGSDNGSRRISPSYLKKVRDWANTIFPNGYTLVKGEGYYRGISEDSVLLYAFVNEDLTLRDQLQMLKHQLKQEAILLVKSPVDYEVV